MANKANLSPIPVTRYKISTTDIVNYLEQNVLGFKIGSGYRVFYGMDRNPHFVEMMISIAPKDIIADNSNPDYIDRVLQKNGAPEPLKDNVIAALEPFMYPKNFGVIRQMPEALERMRYLGVYGEGLDKLINESKLTCGIDPATKSRYFAVALRVESLIADMLSDQETNAPAGEVKTLGVYGNEKQPETICWDVAVISSNQSNPTSGVGIEAIFANTVFKA